MGQRESEPKDVTGPRGGTTTVTARGDIRKNLWIPYALNERLREAAFRAKRTESDLFREGLERLLSELET